MSAPPLLMDTARPPATLCLRLRAPQEFCLWLCADLDVRTPEEFKDGHAPGSVNINVKDEGFKQAVQKTFPNPNEVKLLCVSAERNCCCCSGGGRISKRRAKVGWEKGVSCCCAAN